ncbi:MAG: LysM peptidoglycan-binding domain-containing protein [Bacteroidetes bacterium]|nr:LysM peptidoglycan-binding domain-containing protein [Bacteroidota bacterium]
MIHLYFFAFILLGGKPYHVVKKGETLYSISKEYHFSIEDIRAKNKMTEASIIAIGDTIFFPTEEEIEKKEEQYIFHIVQKGETIFWISRNNTQISFDELIKLNHINSNFEINVGQKIIIGYKKKENTTPKEVLKPDQKNNYTDIKPKPIAVKEQSGKKPNPRPGPKDHCQTKLSLQNRLAP